MFGWLLDFAFGLYLGVLVDFLSGLVIFDSLWGTCDRGIVLHVASCFPWLFGVLGFSLWHLLVVYMALSFGLGGVCVGFLADVVLFFNGGLIRLICGCLVF